MLIVASFASAAPLTKDKEDNKGYTRKVVEAPVDRDVWARDMYKLSTSVLAEMPGSKWWFAKEESWYGSWTGVDEIEVYSSVRHLEAVSEAHSVRIAVMVRKPDTADKAYLYVFDKSLGAEQRVGTKELTEWQKEKIRFCKEDVSSK